MRHALRQNPVDIKCLHTHRKQQPTMNCPCHYGEAILAVTCNQEPFATIDIVWQCRVMASDTTVQVCNAPEQAPVSIELIY